MLEPVSYTFPAESDVFARPTIALTSPNAVPRWWMALWIATILMLGLVAVVAFAMPNIIERVNRANQEQVR